MLKKLKIAAYIDNLLNKQYIAYADINTGGSTNYEEVQTGAPRFAGVTLTASF